ncbi:MAG: hypothetical protein AVDCRST_MAG96-750 [uncultured Segetibacter sp.]|uniref:Uncharacterized protein n=1 Tax=uncultured Segetibacter sp. TaxID=481133 RepID=A0A6J4RLL1_9BACT|nr:MAG: hypothetical protein AVDCRST_MAG96-750 [uncultured Segetibacter sp.]
MEMRYNVDAKAFAGKQAEAFTFQHSERLRGREPSSHIETP